MKILIAFALVLHSIVSLAQVPGDVRLGPVPGISGLNAPLGLKHAGDGSGRIFIVEQGGTIKIINDDGKLLPTPFVDISTRVAIGLERGLLDIAFHPQFGANGRFFLHYSTNANPASPPSTASGDTVIAEFSISDSPDIADPTPEQFILTVRQDFENHNGGQMKFGPDGYLYIGLGDGGGFDDQCNRAQTLDPTNLLEPGEDSCPNEAAALDPSRALLGKMLRIDVDNSTPPGPNNLCAANADGSANYAVPDENPFGDRADRCGEILLYGLRNPWRWSFDRETEDMWIGDVGQTAWEEIDLVPWPLAGGDNLGWNTCEGSWARGSRKIPCPLAGSLLPALEYPHQRTTRDCSVTGGYRYRGPVNSLNGRYVYGDFCSGDVWLARDDSGNWQSDLFQRIDTIRSFGEDEQGNLYVFSGNTLLRFEGDTTDVIFSDGFES